MVPTMTKGPSKAGASTNRRKHACPSPEKPGQHKRKLSRYLRLICVNNVPTFWNQLAGRNVRLKRKLANDYVSSQAGKILIDNAHIE